MKNNRTYKVKFAESVTKHDPNGISYIADDEINKEIINNFLIEEKELNRSYDPDYFDIAKTAILNFWFKNQIELTLLQSNTLNGYDLYTDGKNKMEIKSRNVYEYKVYDNFGYVKFYDEYHNKFYECEIEKYTKEDELLALKKWKNGGKDEFLEQERKSKIKEAEAHNFPKLKGTEKQVNWAIQIRLDKLKKARLLSFDNDHKLTWLLNLPCAKKATFWINNRDKFSEDFNYFIDNFDEQSNELGFQKNWSLTKSDVKQRKVAKQKTINIQDVKDVRKKNGEARLNTAISNTDFISRINRTNIGFFNKIKELLTKEKSIYFKIYTNQNFGAHKTFVIRVYDNKKNASLFTEQFYVQTPKLHNYIEYEKDLSKLRQLKNNLLTANPKLIDDNYSNNVTACSLELAKQLKDLNNKIIVTKEAYIDALPLSEEEQIERILEVISCEYNCDVELIQKDGFVKLFSIIVK